MEGGDGQICHRWIVLCTSASGVIFSCSALAPAMSPKPLRSSFKILMKVNCSNSLVRNQESKVTYSKSAVSDIKRQQSLDCCILIEWK